MPRRAERERLGGKETTLSQDLTLRTGERVAAAIVRAPDPAWTERIERMIGHKGDPWNWQNSELLRSSLGVEARFFLLHRNGNPFANIMLAEIDGVGLLGHVWTEPADRGAGASSRLMEIVLEDFRSRRGRALFLGTDFDSPPWHYYRRRGFEPVEPASGYMELYCQPRAEFTAAWFGPGETVIEPLDWPHWPASAPLFLDPGPGAVRIAATQLIGRRLSEGPVLPILREERRRRAAGLPGCARVLRAATGAAVRGWASYWPDPVWPGGVLLDLHCQARNWDRADDLLAALPRPSADRTVAYADAGFAPKCAALERAGFKPSGRLAKWAAVDAARQTWTDVVAYVRT